MECKVRTIDEGELRDAMGIVAGAFGHGPKATDEIYEDELIVNEPGRFHVAEVGGTTVGTACEYSFELTVPGGGRLPMAGVSCVAVAATHRRRGVLRALMDYELDAVAANGEPLAGLTASEATIYRRFGYGVATWWHAIRVDTSRATFRRAPQVDGGCRLITEEEGLMLLPQVWDRHCRTTPGAIGRRRTWWELYTRDRQDWRDGGSPRYLAVHESSAGAVDGYVEYRIKRGDDLGPGGTVVVVELVADTAEIELALWKYCFDIDLTANTTAIGVRLDMPLRHRLDDPRSLQTTALRDHLWLRLLDVPQCLEARAYPTEGEVVFDVVDGFRLGVAGRYRLEAGPDGASCARTRADADLVLDVAELGGAFLGGVSFQALHDAGVLDEARPGGVARADALFATPRPPYCAMHF